MAALPSPIAVLLHCRLIQGSTNSVRERDVIPDAPCVNEEKSWAIEQEVIVFRRDVDSVRTQDIQYRLDLVGSETELGGEFGFSSSNRLEVEVALSTHSGWQRHSVVL